MFLLQNGALWDMRQMQWGICKMGGSIVLGWWLQWKWLDLSHIVNTVAAADDLATQGTRVSIGMVSNFIASRRNISVSAQRVSHFIHRFDFRCVSKLVRFCMQVATLYFSHSGTFSNEISWNIW